MSDWHQSLRAFGALEETRALLADPRPAWIWSRDGSRIVWANVAGGRSLGAERFAELAERIYPAAHPLRRSLLSVAGAGAQAGTLARLRLSAAARAMPALCRVRGVQSPAGERGLLVVGLDLPPAGDATDIAAVSAFFSDGSDPVLEEDGALSSEATALAEAARLSPQELSAFEEIASALRLEPGAVGTDAPQEAVGGDDESATGQAAPPAGPDGPAQRAGPLGQGAPDFLPSAFASGAAPDEERLAAAERQVRELSAILDTATDGVVTLDRDGRVESLNGSAAALFGIDPGEIAGRSFAELLAPASRPIVGAYLESLQGDGVASLLNEGREVEGLAGSGTIPLFVTLGAVGAEGGGRFCAVLRDITAWKRAEAEMMEARSKAEQASHQKSDFLANISHEIRTPLNAIIGFAEVMIEERFGPVEIERYREYLRDIRTSSEHVLSLVNDLLDISKIEAGKLDLNFAAVAINPLVRECMMLMQPAAGRGHVILRSSLAPDVPDVVADARTLRQIVLNLLSNSVKFTGAGGQVIVSTSVAGEGDVVLRVRDTGEGMSDADLVRALEPFRQLANAELGGRSGTGLGLPLTKALVEANQARFAISSARGEGTMVRVTFPAARVA